MCWTARRVSDILPIKVPFWRWLGLKERPSPDAEHGSAWKDTVACFDQCALGAGLVTRDACRGVPQWRVRHLTAKNYQLDLFDPDDGYYEYSAIVTE